MSGTPRALRRALARCAPLLLCSFAALAGGCGPADDGAEPAATPAPSEEAPLADRPGVGRWRRAGDPSDSAPAEQREMIEQLEAIGYLSGSRPAAGSGVTRHEPSKVAAGLNFYVSGHGPEAVLMDMRGEVLHRWHYDFRRLWPDRPVRKRTNAQFWRRAHLFENGDVVAIFEGLGLIKVDRDSNLVWANPLGAHHDLQVAPNGDIFVLERRAHVVPRISETEPVLEDFLTVVSAEGETRRSVSLLEAFERSKFREIVDSRKRATGDIFHTNSVEILDGRIADRHPEFAAGNLLTAMNALGALAVVDLVRQEVVWARRVEYRGLHDPGILRNGNLLLFENRGELRSSRVIESAPRGTPALWEFTGSDDRPFYSRSCGTAQRLPNGNTLITESDAGRALEVTREGEIVWEFYNPHRGGPAGEFIATLFEVRRLPPDFPTDWLPGASPQSAVSP